MHEGNIEVTDLFLKKEDQLDCFKLPSKAKLIEAAKKQLINSLNRIFEIFRTDANIWCRKLIEKNTMNSLVDKRRNLGIMNRTKQFDSKFIIKLGYKKNTDFSKYTLSSPYLILEEEFLFDHKIMKSTLGLSKKSLCLISFSQEDVANYICKNCNNQATNRLIMERRIQTVDNMISMQNK